MAVFESTLVPFNTSQSKFFFCILIENINRCVFIYFADDAMMKCTNTNLIMRLMLLKIVIFG